MPITGGIGRFRCALARRPAGPAVGCPELRHRSRCAPRRSMQRGPTTGHRADALLAANGRRPTRRTHPGHPARRPTSPRASASTPGEEPRVVRVSAQADGASTTLRCRSLSADRRPMRPAPSRARIEPADLMLRMLPGRADRQDRARGTDRQDRAGRNRSTGSSRSIRWTGWNPADATDRIDRHDATLRCDLHRHDRGVMVRSVDRMQPLVRWGPSATRPPVVSRPMSTAPKLRRAIKAKSPGPRSRACALGRRPRGRGRHRRGRQGRMGRAPHPRGGGGTQGPPRVQDPRFEDAHRGRAGSPVRPGRRVVRGVGGRSCHAPPSATSWGCPMRNGSPPSRAIEGLGVGIGPRADRRQLGLHRQRLRPPRSSRATPPACRSLRHRSSPR